MKTLSKIFISLAVMTVSLASAAAGERLFAELNNLDGVQTVYVGKAMMKLGGSMAGNLGPLADKIDSVEIVSVEKKSSIEKARRLLDKVVSDRKLEVLTETKSGDDQVVIYGKTAGATLDGVIISASEPDEFSIISISGEIPVDQLGSLANGF